MPPTERVRLTTTDFAGLDTVRVADARWYGRDLLIIWQWKPDLPDQPLKSLIVEGARDLATWNAPDVLWELRGNYIFPGYS